jgi:hypothetical protein
MRTLPREKTQAREKRTRKDVFGDVFIDVGKLTFGGIVLAGIFSASINKALLISIGALFCVMAIAFGVFLVTKK